MSERDDEPKSWLTKLIMLYAGATIYAIGAFFLLSDSTGSLTSFLSGVPHYPMRGLRAIHLDGVTAGISAICHHLVHALRSHMYLLAAITLVLPFVTACLLFIAELMTNSDAIEWTRGWHIGAWLLGKLVALGLVLATTVACSTLLTGLHLVRAHDRWLSGGPDGNVLLKDLMLANQPMTFASASATITRFFALDDRATARPRNALEVKLHAIADELEHTPRAIDETDLTISGVWSMMVFQVAITMEEISDRAFRGRGGERTQPWRELRFVGPTGSPIRIRTNFLPPDQRGKLLLGRAAALDQGWLEFERKSNEAYAAPWTAPCKVSTQALLAAAAALSPDDVLVRVAYGMISSYCSTRSMFEDMLPGIKLSTEDAYGELVITLHNSQSSYDRAVSKDLPGTGLYIPEKNQMVVWEDEPTATKNEALALLNVVEHQIQDKVEFIDWRDGPKALETMFRRIDKGFMQVIPHEASHWVLHTLLNGVLPGNEPLPPCLDEGFAANVDRIDTLIAERLANGDSGWKREPRAPARARMAEKPAASGPGPASYAATRIELFGDSKTIDWPRFWLSEGVDVTATPADSVAMEGSHLYEGAIHDRRHAYAECYVLARLFGRSILTNAIAGRHGLAAGLKDLRVPWSMIRAYIASRRADVPADLIEEFLGNGSQR